MLQEWRPPQPSPKDSPRHSICCAGLAAARRRCASQGPQKEISEGPPGGPKGLLFGATSAGARGPSYTAFYVHQQKQQQDVLLLLLLLLMLLTCC